MFIFTTKDAFDVVTDPTAPLNFDEVIKYAKAATEFELHWASVPIAIIVVAILALTLSKDIINRHKRGYESVLWAGITALIIGGVAIGGLQTWTHNTAKRHLEYEVTRTWVKDRYGLSFTDSSMKTLDPQTVHDGFKGGTLVLTEDESTVFFALSESGLELYKRSAVAPVETLPGIPASPHKNAPVMPEHVPSEYDDSAQAEQEADTLP